MPATSARTLWKAGTSTLAERKSEETKAWRTWSTSGRATCMRSGPSRRSSTTARRLARGSSSARDYRKRSSRKKRHVRVALESSQSSAAPVDMFSYMCRCHGPWFKDRILFMCHERFEPRCQELLPDPAAPSGPRHSNAATDRLSASLSRQPSCGESRLDCTCARARQRPARMCRWFAWLCAQLGIDSPGVKKCVFELSDLGVLRFAPLPS